MAKKPKRSLPFDTQSYIKRADKLKERLGNESDRGKVILCGMILDEELEMLIRIHMRELPKNLEKDIFSGFGPLSTFSGKTKLAYALQLIDDDVYSDLNVIRDIRNHLAHAYDSDSPYDEWFSETTKRLKFGVTNEEDLNDKCFRLCVREERQPNDETWMVSPGSTTRVLIATFLLARSIRIAFLKRRDG